jgi:hypothetical protein
MAVFICPDVFAMRVLAEQSWLKPALTSLQIY